MDKYQIERYHKAMWHGQDCAGVMATMRPGQSYSDEDLLKKVNISKNRLLKALKKLEGFGDITCFQYNDDIMWKVVTNDE